MDDAAAARACGTGNVDAFRHFVDRYQSRALSQARLLTRNEADAADATQDAFVDAFRNLRAVDPGRPDFQAHRCSAGDVRPSMRASHRESGIRREEEPCSRS
jgi:DNA-directed RNA polymerase specialized sigma24 family protein